MLNTMEKEMSKEMYFGVFYVFKLTFGEVEMNFGFSLCQKWLR